MTIHRKGQGLLRLIEKELFQYFSVLGFYTEIYNEILKVF